MGFVMATTKGTGMGTTLITAFAAITLAVTTSSHSRVNGPDTLSLVKLTSAGSHGTGTVVAGTSLMSGTISVMDVHGFTVDNVGGNVETSGSGKEACECIDVSDVSGNIIVVIGKGPVTGLVVSIVPVSSVLHTEETKTVTTCVAENGK